MPAELTGPKDEAQTPALEVSNFEGLSIVEDKQPRRHLTFDTLNKKVRKDMHGNVIKKGAQKHKVTFRDEFEQDSMPTIEVYTATVTLNPTVSSRMRNALQIED